MGPHISGGLQPGGYTISILACTTLILWIARKLHFEFYICKVHSGIERPQPSLLYTSFCRFNIYLAVPSKTAKPPNESAIYVYSYYYVEFNSAQVNQNMLILWVVNDLLELEVFDGTPRSKIDIRTMVGALDGEALAKGKCSHGNRPTDSQLVVLNPSPSLCVGSVCSE